MQKEKKAEKAVSSWFFEEEWWRKISGCRCLSAFLLSQSLSLWDRKHWLNPHGRELFCPRNSLCRLHRILAWARTSSAGPACCPGVRTEEYIIFCIMSLIYSKSSSYSGSNMHAKGCPETYSRIRCHVLLRFLVNVQIMIEEKKKTPPNVCW